MDKNKQTRKWARSRGIDTPIHQLAKNLVYKSSVHVAYLLGILLGIQLIQNWPSVVDILRLQFGEKWMLMFQVL